MAATDTLERTKITGTNNNLFNIVGKNRAKKEQFFFFNMTIVFTLTRYSSTGNSSSSDST